MSKECIFIFIYLISYDLFTLLVITGDGKSYKNLTSMNSNHEY